jgi:hypothetical protein
MRSWCGVVCRNEFPQRGGREARENSYYYEVSFVLDSQNQNLPLGVQCMQWRPLTSAHGIRRPGTGDSAAELLNCYQSGRCDTPQRLHDGYHLRCVGLIILLIQI